MHFIVSDNLAIILNEKDSEKYVDTNSFCNRCCEVIIANGFKFTNIISDMTELVIKSIIQQVKLVRMDWVRKSSIFNMQRATVSLMGYDFDNQSNYIVQWRKTSCNVSSNEKSKLLFLSKPILLFSFFKLSFLFLFFVFNFN